ncbi:MAG: hypothetical protein QOE90_1977 [Thermoplasmata archaeon]|jgi:GNAT superfamily N-acetyltransferase|nr:hypothetical protein [Thermoplasmata archaeon]
MKVRRVTPAEQERYRAFRLRALAEDPAAFGRALAEEQAFPPEEWTRRLTRPGVATFVAEEADAWLGMAGAGLHVEGPPEVFGMWVAPEARSRGVGLALLDACAAWAREQGATRLTLWVNLAQAPALRLYRKAGFAPEGEPMRGTRDPTRVFQSMTKALEPDAD